MSFDRPDLTLQAVLADQLMRIRHALMFINCRGSDSCRMGSRIAIFFSPLQVLLCLLERFQFDLQLRNHTPHIPLVSRPQVEVEVFPCGDLCADVK
jgi:hypothetical protein